MSADAVDRVAAMSSELVARSLGNGELRAAIVVAAMSILVLRASETGGDEADNLKRLLDGFTEQARETARDATVRRVVVPFRGRRQDA